MASKVIIHESEEGFHHESGIYGKVHIEGTIFGDCVARIQAQKMQNPQTRKWIVRNVRQH